MKGLLFLVGLTGFVAFCTPIHAQTAQCLNHGAFVVALADRYGERRQMAGLNGDGTIVEIYANDATGTWTALIVQPDGMACMVAAGEGFDSSVAKLPADM